MWKMVPIILIWSIWTERKEITFQNRERATKLKSFFIHILLSTTLSINFNTLRVRLDDQTISVELSILRTFENTLTPKHIKLIPSLTSTHPPPSVLPRQPTLSLTHHLSLPSHQQSLFYIFQIIFTFYCLKLLIFNIFKC